MTYNFDPDRWYENELLLIQSKYKTGQITKREHDDSVDELEHKHASMWERLDNSYQLPKKTVPI